MSEDKRYTINLEFCGHMDGKRHVLRFCGEYIGNFASRREALTTELQHNRARLLDEFTEAYILCALWSSTDDAGEPLDNTYSIADLADSTFDKMKADCNKFLTENWNDIKDNLKGAGHDFWLTRNGHGAGFWDGDWPEAGERLTEACKRYPEIDLYVGDDGKIYC